MVSLTTDQYEFIHFYNDLLNTIEEGFDYVVGSFTDLQLTEGDKIFKDILSAFYQVDSSHSTMRALLKEETELIKAIKNFDQVILTLDGESSIFSTLEQHHEFVKNQLAPAYIAWKESIQHQLQPYITH
ncbi:MAG: hypothetical protein ACQEWV_17285 [Bacillota bacterium]